jgi:hypothetical protein
MSTLGGVEGCVNLHRSLRSTGTEGKSVLREGIRFGRINRLVIEDDDDSVVRRGLLRMEKNIKK